MYEPRAGGTYPRGPAGGVTRAVFSDLLLCAGIDIAVPFEGGWAGAVKFRLPLGPIGGALNTAGPLGGDLGVGRIGDRSLGVDLAESRSLYTIWVGGDRSCLGGERALATCDIAANRLGWI
jgi:hypothetical protein